MRVSYLFGGQVTLDDAVVDDYYRRSPSIRNAYAEAASCAGLAVEDFRSTTAVRGPEFGHSLSALRHAALTLGLAEELRDRGIEPDAVGGLSLGALIGACVAGAVEREELFAMLFARRLVPPLPEDAPAQGMVLVSAPIDHDPEDYYGDRPGIYLAVDTGPIDQDSRSFVLSGYRAALQELISSVPEGTHMFLLDGYKGAFHSPLQRYAADFMASFVATMTFHDPKIPICSPIARNVLTTAAQVEEFVTGHNLLPARYEPLIDEMYVLGIRSGLVVGAGLPAPAVSPFPVELFTEPADLDRLPEVLPLALGRR
ncbi:acyltransferase domain-containing protein [Nocardia jejuensis]|uniref:acyltransferase domain-containing protein n=1 Tax=Nocardia jejuensis TaxID=328049 RepID=UPI000B190360|nr:acyltransferase domain-containing protein [Nocardia jejuensis]